MDDTKERTEFSLEMYHDTCISPGLYYHSRNGSPEHSNRSTEFWNELDKKMPDYREHENWLKRKGVKMSL